MHVLIMHVLMAKLQAIDNVINKDSNPAVCMAVELQLLTDISSKWHSYFSEAGIGFAQYCRIHRAESQL